MEGSKEVKQWQNAIQHNLLLGKKLFTKVPREGTGSLWLLNPGVESSNSKKTSGKTKKASGKNTKNSPVPQLVSNQSTIHLSGKYRSIYFTIETRYLCFVQNNLY